MLSGSQVVGLALVVGTVSSGAQNAPAPKPPAALTIASATRSAVALTWTPGDATPAKFIVERKAFGTGWPAGTNPSAPRDPKAPPTPSTIATVQTASATDSAIDAYATYVYRVRALGPDDVPSAPSNEVTAGPPPVGLSTVLAAPKDLQAHDPTQFANQIRMVFDANDDPALAYVTYDVNNDGDPSDTELSFISWNRARYRWNAPVHVDTVGDVTKSGSRPPFSIALDPSNNRFGLLYVVGEHEIRLAMSDDAGARWKAVPIQKTLTEEGTLATPSLALAGGVVHAAYYLGQVGVRYRTGLASDAPDKWSGSTAPLLPGTTEARSEGVTVALDAGGKPAVVYWLNPSDGYTLTMAFWRPGGTATKVTDTAGHQTDDPALHMVVSGATIAIGLYANRDDQFFSSHQIWFVRSTDNGASWSPAVAVADDGGSEMRSPVTVSVGRTGQVAMAAEMSGGDGVGTKCGLPKLMRSPDGMKWTTCAPDTKGAPLASDVTYPVIAFAGNDKLYIAFKTRGTAPGLGPGLSLWRER